MISRCLAIRVSSITAYTVAITTQHSSSVATTTHSSRNTPLWARPTSNNKTTSNTSNSWESTTDEKANTPMRTVARRSSLCRRGARVTRAESAKACSTKIRLKTNRARHSARRTIICRFSSRVNSKTDLKCRTVWVSSRINILGRRTRRAICYWIRWISMSRLMAYSYPRKRKG